MQQQSAATRPTPIDPRSTELTWPPVQMTLTDLIADSSHREGQGHYGALTIRFEKTTDSYMSAVRHTPPVAETSATSAPPILTPLT